MLPKWDHRNKMDHENLNSIIGSSGFILYEECYEYNEDACYLANDKEAARQFMINCGYTDNEFRIDDISIADIMKDYGCSLGEYAMEQSAFERFKIAAHTNSFHFNSEPFDCDSSLMVVTVDNKETAQYSD